MDVSDKADVFIFALFTRQSELLIVCGETRKHLFSRELLNKCFQAWRGSENQYTGITGM